MKLLRCYNSRRNSGNVVSSVSKAGIWLLGVLLYARLAEGTLTFRKPCLEVECLAWQYCSQLDHVCRNCSDICVPGQNNFDENRCEQDCQDYLHDIRYVNQNATLVDLVLEQKYKNLEDEVVLLKVIIGVCAAVILVVVAVLAAFLVYFWKLLHPSEPSSPEEKKQKNKSTPKSASSTMELPTVYNNRGVASTPTPENSPSSGISSNPSPADTNVTTFTSSTVPYHQSGTARASPETITTTLTTTPVSTLTGTEFHNLAGSPNRFRRREPSESTLPENCAYDNLSMSPQHQAYYSHHV